MHLPIRGHFAPSWWQRWRLKLLSSFTIQHHIQGILVDMTFLLFGHLRHMIIWNFFINPGSQRHARFTPWQRRFPINYKRILYKQQQNDKCLYYLQILFVNFCQVLNRVLSLTTAWRLRQECHSYTS